MWYALYTRKEFSEYMLGGRTPARDISEVKEIYDFSDVGSDQVFVGWKDKPSCRRDLPILAVVDEDRIKSTLATLNSGANSFSPYTAFFRLLAKSTAQQYAEQPRANAEVGSSIIDALVGVCFAEAMILSEGQMQYQDLSPAICRRTLAYSWSRALNARIPRPQLNKLIDGWVEAYGATSSQARADSIREKSSMVIPILKLAADLHYEQPSESVLADLCRSLIENDKELQERAWKILSAKLPEVISLSTLGSVDREERGAYLQSLMKFTYAEGMGGEIGAAMCAFVATQIAPGSLQHIDFLANHPDPRLLLWYGFFALLQGANGATLAGGGLSARVLRDLRTPESLDEGPEADISMEEFRMLSRSNLGGLAKKLAHSNEIDIEIVPLVSCTFRYSSRPLKQKDLFDTESEIPETQAGVDTATKEPLDRAKLAEALRLLEQVRSTLTPTSNSPYQKGIVKRTRKKE